MLFGLLLTAFHVVRAGDFALAFAERFFIALLAVGLFQLVRNLYKAVREVNVAGAAPDTTEWETRP